MGHHFLKSLFVVFGKIESLFCLVISFLVQWWGRVPKYNLDKVLGYDNKGHAPVSSNISTCAHTNNSNSQCGGQAIGSKLTSETPMEELSPTLARYLRIEGIAD